MHPAPAPPPTGRPQPPGTGPSSFAQALRAHRRAARLTQAQLGAHLGYHHSLISKIESGARVPPPGLAQAADAALGAGGTLAALAPVPGPVETGPVATTAPVVSLAPAPAVLSHNGTGPGRATLASACAQPLAFPAPPVARAPFLAMSRQTRYVPVQNRVTPVEAELRADPESEPPGARTSRPLLSLLSGAHQLDLPLPANWPSHLREPCPAHGSRRCPVPDRPQGTEILRGLPVSAPGDVVVHVLAALLQTSVENGALHTIEWALHHMSPDQSHPLMRTAARYARAAATLRAEQDQPAIAMAWLGQGLIWSATADDPATTAALLADAATLASSRG